MGVRTWLRRRSRVWLVVPLAVLVATASTGAWLLTRDTSSAAAGATTATVASETMTTTVAASGTIEAARTADLDFAVSGTITRVRVTEGDRVTKGQALATVDAASLVAQRTAARASLTAAYAQLDDDEDAAASDTQLAADRAQVLSAKATLADARDAVDDATLRATIAGTVVSVEVARGDVVGAGSGGSSTGEAATGSAASSTTTTTTSTSAVTIVSTGRFHVDTTVAAADVESLEKGMQAEVTPSGATDVLYGTVATVGRVAEVDSSGAAVFPVTVDVTGTRKDLYAGTSADVSIITAQVPDVLTVPSRALHTDGDTTYVVKVVDGDHVRTTVETGTTYGMSTEVVSGVVAGDVVEIPGFTRPTGGGAGGEGGDQQFPGGGELPGGGQFPGGGTGGAGLQGGPGQ